MTTEDNLLFDWIHVPYREHSAYSETYGFSGSQNLVNLEGILIRPAGRSSSTLTIFIHPSSTLQHLPMPRALARGGAHVLCAGTRYARNDTAAIMEKMLLDLGAYIRHARDVLGYSKVVLFGWSGGGSLALFYQAEAERTTVTHTPAGDPVDIAGAGLVPADAVVFQAAHISRSALLAEIIDPSVLDEADPTRRNPELDIYRPENLERVPFDAAFIARYRAAQLERVRKITGWVKATLAVIREGGELEVERGFVTHRTFADLRFVDPGIDPNDRKPRWSYLGDPAVANCAPAGLARFSTLRSWLSQWSIDDSKADALACAARVGTPLLVVENSADDGVPASHPQSVFTASNSAGKHYLRILGGTHYYAGQPEQLALATTGIASWISDQGC